MPKAPIHTGTIAKAALSHFAALLRVQRKERNLTLDELHEQRLDSLDSSDSWFPSLVE